MPFVSGGGGGGGTQPYVRKTITYADFLAAMPTHVIEAFDIPEGDVLVSLGFQIPVAFDFTGTNAGMTITVDGGATIVDDVFDLSSDTTTGPGLAVLGYGVGQTEPSGNAPQLPIVGGTGGSTVSVQCNGFGTDGTMGTLVLIAEIATPTDL